MDHFHEEVVKKRNRLLDEVCYYLSLAVMVLAGLFALLQFQALLNYLLSGQAGADPAGLALEIVIILGAAAVAILVFLFRDRLRTEYEYTFTNGALDFAQVFNNRKRKTLGSLNVRNVEAFGPVNGSAFQRYISMQGIEQTRWFLNRDGNLYYFYFQKNNNKRIIIFEPSEELVGLIRHYLPQNVWQG